MPPLLLIKIAIAAVWLYEGLWCKLLGREANQRSIVEAHPLFRGRGVAFLLKAIGAAEVGLAVWVLAGWAPWLCALAQTGLLVGMNANGLWFARRLIHDPGGMVVKNFAFLVLAWVAAGHALS